MSTAQAYYEIFKSLPKKTRKEVQKLINEEKKYSVLADIEEGLKELKLIREGKKKPILIEDFLRDLKNEG